MTRSQESASTPISAGGYRYNPDDTQDRVDFLHHTAAELAVLAREAGYDFTDHHRYDPLVVGVGRDEIPAATAEQRQLLDDTDAAIAAGRGFAHELDDADLGETAATAWPERSLGFRRDVEPAITDDQITALRDEAGTAGDLDQVAVCDRALAGDAEARAECQRVITDAAAMES